VRVLNPFHEYYVHGRRVRRLCAHLIDLFPTDAQGLDVGCGDGQLASALMQQRPDIKIGGLEVLVRPQAPIIVKKFDGYSIPYEDKSFDLVMFIDVLHHTEHAQALLEDAVRVARQTILIKDHLLSGIFAGTTLRFMDYVGNQRHGVALPYCYWSQQQWLEVFEKLQVRVGEWRTKLNLYPWPASWLFDRSLHFIVRLDVL